MDNGRDAHSVKSLSRHTLEQMVTLSSEGILLADAQDPNLPIVYANPAYEGLSGYSADELTGNGWQLVKRDSEGQPELERLNGVHVLIVEDDADSRNVLTVLLQRLGALVEAVGSAGEAFDRLDKRRPDVLVSDIGMPGEDGYSLIRRVRQITEHRSLPAIALTAYARKQDADLAIASGYDRHLPKPVAPAELIRAIKGVMIELSPRNGTQAPRG